MVSAKNISGNILIPLLIILLLSAGVFSLSQYFAKAQTDVSAAIDSRFQGMHVSPANVMERSLEKWESYENKGYNYQIKFPKQWVSSNTDPIKGDLSTYERFLGSKINLKVSIRNKFEIPQNTNLAKFGENRFYVDLNHDDIKSATTEHNKLFYTVTLTQNNYFSENIDFTGTFFHILQSLKFTK